mmetsp:Transcript_22944/g.52005  ORF Transcript_22944/g.52005 Transcript_22944/m.52005 type:complete len:82 (-) Transcript_22944:824-1069(-)
MSGRRSTLELDCVIGWQCGGQSTIGYRTCGSIVVANRLLVLRLPHTLRLQRKVQTEHSAHLFRTVFHSPDSKLSTLRCAQF